MSRYSRRETAINDLEEWEKVLKKRHVKRIEQYRTTFLRKYDDKLVDCVEHRWRIGDKFWTLSDSFYGDPKYWYVIARYNNAPTEANVKLGDIIKIPISLSHALQVIV